MDTMDTRSLVTNQKVADDLGITHSAVSRIRSGDRFPSLTLIMKIEGLLHWSMADQARRLGSPAYAVEFENRLAHHYDQ